MRKLAEKNVRKLTRLGKSSLAITLPKEILARLGWREKQKVAVRKRGNGIFIADWTPQCDGKN
jgi:bifunctional DNA-binding transcriptional regulator/antitoxin component of YhaV-PrlF toxin-antitoxin module